MCPGPRLDAWSLVPSHSPWALVIPSRDRGESGVAILARERNGTVSLCLLPLGCFALESLEGKSEARAPQSCWHYPAAGDQGLGLQQGWCPGRETAVRWKVRAVRRGGKRRGSPFSGGAGAEPPGEEGPDHRCRVPVPGAGEAGREGRRARGAAQALSL